MTAAHDELRQRVSTLLPEVRRDLENLIRIESVSADPGRLDEVRRCAGAVAALFAAEGFETFTLQAAGGMPAVVAKKSGPPGAPSVLLYAHHDVQPEGDRGDWTSEPFEPTERGDRLYARGAADDKAGIAVHLAAIRALGDRLPVGVTVFVEGEEEIGSPTLEALLAKHRHLLRSDVIVIADSTNWDLGVPALTTTLRGLVECTVEVRTLEHAVHSGMWGGVVPDALTTLCRLLATLHDDKGDVAVEGLTSARAADLVYDEDRARAESGIAGRVPFYGTGSMVQRLWAKPAAAVIGLDTTRIADASNTLIPVARARVSVRVAPGDDGRTALAHLHRHLESHAPWGALVVVEDGPVGESFAIDAQGPAFDAARTAFREAWDGVEPVDIGVGGSIPFIASFAAIFPDAAILVTGVEDPDTRAHGADEGLHLREFERACVAETLLLHHLGRSAGTASVSTV
jgi:acetylornithine deacetylase/succinyl-diaminopimelate desuccinylase-like protein